MGLIKDLFESLDVNIGLKSKDDGTTDISFNMKSKQKENKIRKEIVDKINAIEPNVVAGSKLILDSLPTDDE